MFQKRFVSLLPDIQQKQHIILMRFFVGGDNRARQQRSVNACICERSVQCDRGTGAHGVRKGGETALFEPDVVSRHIKKAQHIMLRVF